MSKIRPATLKGGEIINNSSDMLPCIPNCVAGIIAVAAAAVTVATTADVLVILRTLLLSPNTCYSTSPLIMLIICPYYAHNMPILEFHMAILMSNIVHLGIICQY